MPSTPRPFYTSRSYATILAELQALVAKTRSPLLSQLSASDLGGLLLEALAYVGDIGSFAVDAAALEMFALTAKRYGSGLRAARSVGYVPQSAVAATVSVTSDTLPADLTTNGGTIVAGQTFVSTGGVTFEVLTAVVIAVADTTTTFTLTEGVSYVDTFQTTNLARQRVRTDNGVVGEGSWDVYVGDPALTLPWVQVDDVASELNTTETYEVQFDGDGRLLVQFGDGTAGKIPDDTITIQYRTCSGADGNLPAGAVSGRFRAAVTGLGYDLIVTVTNAAAASGGVDRETLESLRTNLQTYMRTHGRVVTIRDYDAAPLDVTGVAAAFADLWFSSYNANALKVYIWASESETFTSESLVASVRSAVDYTRFVQAGVALGSSVQSYLAARTVNSVFVEIVRPDVAWVDLYLGDITYTRSYDAVALHEAITEAVVDLFETSGGLNMRLASLYRAIRDVDGVEHFEVQRAVYEHASKTRATGSVQFTGGVSPLDTETLSMGDGSATVVFEFDDNAAFDGNNIQVEIGLSAHDTMANLVQAITDNLPNIIPTKTANMVPTCTLVQTLGGVAYNIALVKTVGASMTLIGMSGGSETEVDVQDDHRRLQTTPGSAQDDWSPGAYVPGEPFTGLVAWQDGGIIPYLPLADLAVVTDRYSARYYEEATTYNHEIIYDPEPDASTVPEALCLRRLVFELVPSTE